MPQNAATPADVGPLWVDGEFWLKVCDSLGERLVHVRRPYGLLGRLDGADVQIDDRAVSARHVFLHIDPRGLYAVDLSSRTGTRFPVAGQPAAWLETGQEFEVAGRRVRFLDYRVHQDRCHPEMVRADLLGVGDGALARVVLYPMPAHDAPRTLDSELVFAGRGATCGVRIEGASASRVHAAILRTRSSAYVIDLLGRGTWLNERPVPGAAPLADHDVLGIGVARFDVRVTPVVDLGRTSTPGPNPGRPAEGRDVASVGLVHRNGSQVEGPPALVPSEILAPNDSVDSTALVGLVMRLVHAGQSESLRRQDEFQLNLVRLIHQMHADNASLLSEHLKSMESIQQELARLREELATRLRAHPPASHPGRPGLSPPDSRPPLRIASPNESRPVDTEAATDWLLHRVSQLEEQHRSTWKDLLGRLSGNARSAH